MSRPISYRKRRIQEEAEYKPGDYVVYRNRVYLIERIHVPYQPLDADGIKSCTVHGKIHRYKPHYEADDQRLRYVLSSNLIPLVYGHGPVYGRTSPIVLNGEPKSHSWTANQNGWNYHVVLGKYLRKATAQDMEPYIIDLVVSKL